MSVCFHTSIVAISNSLNIKFESALFQFHWERKREGGGIEALFLLLAILVSCGCGRRISDYILISDHYKVTTGLGCWWRSEAAGCGLSLRMRGSWEDTASANRSRVLEMSDQSEARDTEREDRAGAGDWTLDQWAATSHQGRDISQWRRTLGEQLRDNQPLQTGTEDSTLYTTPPSRMLSSAS